MKIEKFDAAKIPSLEEARLVIYELRIKLNEVINCVNDHEEKIYNNKKEK